MKALATGSAGRRGEDVRSDLWVEVAVSREGDLDIDLTSRVAPYYGDAIRRQVRETLVELGVEHARVRVEDAGALPFVIVSRVEAAAQSAGVTVPDETPFAGRAVARAASARDRPRRSRLYLPGNEPYYFITAGLHEPDAVILDLEDSVHPEHKDAARLLVRNALAAVDFHGAETMVRINPLPTGRRDLECVLLARPDLVLVPKVEHPAQIREVDEVVSRVSGRDEGPPWLMPILETALGIENAFAIAGASGRNVALTLGLEDYAADLGVPRSASGEESLYARMRVVNAARAAGLAAIDSVFSDVADLDGLRAWGARSRALGFEGMGCLHPRQVPVIHEAYAPTVAEVERALRIVAVYERAQADGLGVVSLGSKMLDPPVIAQALRVVHKARIDGRIPADAKGGE